MPGILLAIGLAAVAWWWEVRKETIIAAAEDLSGRRSARRCVEGFWALMLPVIIIVGLKFGVFTPTEAAVVAAVYSLFVAVFDLPRAEALASCYAVFVTAAKTTGVVMFLVAAALVSA